MKKDCHGMCGLNCTQCPAFVALQMQDDSLREKTAIEWTERYGHPFSPEMINCTGCLSQNEPHIGHCQVCLVRQCGLQKQVKGCVSCKEFQSCQTRKQFEVETGLNMQEISKQ